MVMVCAKTLQNNVAKTPKFLRTIHPYFSYLTYISITKCTISHQILIHYKIGWEEQGYTNINKIYKVENYVNGIGGL